MKFDPLTLIELVQSFPSQRTQQFQFFLLLGLLLFQKPQPRSQHFARVVKFPLFDLLVHEPVETLGQIDIPRRHSFSPHIGDRLSPPTTY